MQIQCHRHQIRQGDKEIIDVMIDQLIVIEGLKKNGKQQYATLLEIYLRNQHNILN